MWFQNKSAKTKLVSAIYHRKGLFFQESYCTFDTQMYSKMIYRLVVVCLLILAATEDVSAQYDYVSDSVSTGSEKKKKPFKLSERLVFAGNMGLSFGNFTYVQASPMVGVKLRPNLTCGVGLDYAFIGAQGYRSQNLYGGNLWSRYFITDNIFLTTQYQALNRELYTPRDGYYRANVNMFFVGGGIFVGDRDGVGATITGMYDVIEDPNSPFSNPVIRIGTAFGF